MRSIADDKPWVTRPKRGQLPTAQKLIEIAAALRDRSGGYVRIVKLPFRKRDAADMALIQWTGGWKAEEDDKSKGKELRKDRKKKDEKKKEEKK